MTLPEYTFAAKKSKANDKINSGIEYVNLDFWNDFGDEYLSDYIVQAVKNNYDLKNATLKTEEYKKFVSISFGQELPHLTIGAQADWLRTPLVDIGAVKFAPRSTGLYSVPLLVSYEADIFLKNRGKTKAVKKAWEASKFAEQSAYISMVSAVATVYFNLVNTDELLRLQEEIVKLKKENLSLYTFRVEKGLSANNELNAVQQDYLRAVTEYNNLKQQQNTLSNKLSVLIGQSPEENVELKRSSINDLSYKKEIPETISSDVIFSRPDILQVEAQLEKAKIDIKTARKELLPSFPLVGVLGFGTTEFSNIFSKDAFFATLGANALQTVFAGGAKINNLKLKKIQYEEMLNSYHQADIVALQEVNDALYGAKNAKSVLDDMNTQYTLEGDNFKYSNLKYEKGLYSQIDKNNAEIKFLMQQKGFSTAKSNLFISYITLYKAVGAKI